MNTCAAALKRRLAEHGGWLGREDLGRVGDFSAGRVDDDLADLVIEGSVLFNPRGREYKLAGSPLARKALQQMLASGDSRRVLGAQSADKTKYRLAVAVRTRDFNGAELLVMGEVEQPYPSDAEALERMARQICQWEQSAALLNDVVVGKPPIPAQR